MLEVTKIEPEVLKARATELKADIRSLEIVEFQLKETIDMLEEKKQSMNATKHMLQYELGETEKELNKNSRKSK